MTSPSDQFRTYSRSESIVFFRTKEAFGGLSNMASGFPLRVNGIRIHTSEALYQACRFPHLPDLQQKIIAEHSPMTAKMRGKPFRDQSRPDWDSVRVKIMRWCLRVKLAQNWKSFADLLLATGNKPIVEQSRKDEFWGAKEAPDGTLSGMNVLGRLLMELREEVKSVDADTLRQVAPLSIPDFLLYERTIETVSATEFGSATTRQIVTPAEPLSRDVGGFAEQASFFDRPVASNHVLERIAGGRRTGGLFKNLKPYSDCKQSGTTWLGHIPRHWTLSPGLAAFREKHVKNIGLQEKRLLSLSYGRIVVKSQEKLGGLLPKSFSTYQIVDPGDIIVRSTDLQNDKTSLRIGRVRDRGIITSAYICLRTTQDVLPEYGFQLLNACDLTKALYGMGSGLRQNLAWADFKRMSVPIPPTDEQASITRFLSYATKKIERVILVKRRLISTLSERKRVTIQRAVTLGLNPKVALKPSGIAWLGKMPSNWDIRPLKQMLRRMDYGTSENVRGEGRVRVLTMGHIRDGRIVLPQHGGLDTVPNGLLLENNDLLFNRTNSPELVGKVGIFTGQASDEVTFASYLVRLKVRREYNPNWLNFLLNSEGFWGYARSHALVSLHQANLNSSRYGRMMLPVPSEDERNEIATFIEAEAAEVERAASTTEREIKLLLEYRTRLIADVVTGKVDVRQVAAQLPEFAEDEVELVPLSEMAELESVEDAIAGAAHG